MDKAFSNPTAGTPGTSPFTHMSSPIRHHYLPVFYLGRWRGDAGRVVRYHRPYDKTVASRRMPEHTAYEDGLYSLEGESPNDREMIEREFFSFVDSEAAPVLAQMLAHGVEGLGNARRVSWTRFLMSLQHRNPHSLGEIKTATDRDLRETLERLDGEKYSTTKREGNPESVYDFARQQDPELFGNAYKMQMTKMIDNQVVGDWLITMHWTVVDLSSSGHTLLTADRPYTQSSGFGFRQCLVAVPLSPTHLFLAANDPGELRTRMGYPADQTVFAMNDLMARLAIRNVYGCDDAHLAFVDERLRRASDPVIPGILAREAV